VLYQLNNLSFEHSDRAISSAQVHQPFTYGILVDEAFVFVPTQLVALQASPSSRPPLCVTIGTRSSALTSDLSQVGLTPNAFTSTDARQHGRYSLRALEDTLDWMHEHNEPFLGGYEMCSGLERFEGGQGLVQFCHRLHRKEEFAIKCAYPKTAPLSS
jgi:hypothetical protein